MYRNLFAVVATLALGAGVASAATSTNGPSSQSLEQRFLAAQKTIGSVVNTTQTPAVKAGSDKVAQYYWHNWSNYFRNYYGG